MTSPFEEESACWDGFDIIPRSKGGYYINSLDVGQLQHETRVGHNANGKSVAQDEDEEVEDMVNGDEEDEDMEDEDEPDEDMEDEDEEDEDMGDEDDEDMEDEDDEDMGDGDEEDMDRSEGADVPNPAEEELVCASFF